MAFPDFGQNSEADGPKFFLAPRWKLKVQVFNERWEARSVGVSPVVRLPCNQCAVRTAPHCIKLAKKQLGCATIEGPHWAWYQNLCQKKDQKNSRIHKAVKNRLNWVSDVSMFLLPGYNMFVGKDEA